MVVLGSMKRNISFMFVLLLLLCSCTSEQKESSIVNFFSMKDCRPPQLMEVYCYEPCAAQLMFDEEVFIEDEWFSDCSVTVSGQTVSVEFGYELTPDMFFEIDGKVCDRYGNSTSFCVNVWGFNPSPVSALINEVTTKSSDTQPERTELLITGRGDLAGLTVYDGIPEDRKQSVILPSVKLSGGDYVVIYWAERLPGTDEDMLITINEEGHTVVSICSGSKTGLSDDNGIITLASSPSQGAEVLDCFIYSSFESTKYEGFGTKAVYERVLKAKENDWWLTQAVNSSKSTATRSMSRRLTEDTDTYTDWYTTVSRGQSFGKRNMSAEYSE